ncbi:Hpt domain-containing protein [Candidatus Dependentiae bacterium]|nr:Hpt domain-containing protein [Candidatus Dependentiae bacterium]
MDPEKRKQYLSIFLNEVEDQLAGTAVCMKELENDSSNPEPVHTIFRYVHTIKGNSASCGLTNLSKLTHSLENAFGALRDGKLTFDENIKKCLNTGIYLLAESIEQIKVDPDIDQTFNFDDYKSQLTEIIEGKPGQQKSKYKIPDKIVFTEKEIDEYKKKYKNFTCRKVTVIFDRTNMFADIKMFQFLMAVDQSGIHIMRMIPDREYLGKEDFTAELCDFKLEFFLDSDKQTESALKKSIELNIDSIQDYHVDNVDLRDYSEKKKKTDTVTLPDKYLLSVIVKKGSDIYAVICLNIIKIVELDEKIFWHPFKKNIGLIRFLDRAAPVVKICESCDNENKILLVNSVNGIVGLLIDEIIEIKKINPNEIFLDLTVKDMVYSYGNKNIKIIDVNNLVNYELV